MEEVCYYYAPSISIRFCLPTRYGLFPLTTVRKIKLNRTNHSFVSQIQTTHIGLLWPKFTDRFLCWLTWFNTIHCVSRAGFSLELSIGVIDVMFSWLGWPLIRVLAIKSQYSLPLRHVCRILQWISQPIKPVDTFGWNDQKLGDLETGRIKNRWKAYEVTQSRRKLRGDFEIPRWP